MGAPPLVETTQSAELPLRRDAKAIQSPLGDHVGCMSVVLPLVIGVDEDNARSKIQIRPPAS
jgi:hypothetical protein